MRFTVPMAMFGWPVVAIGCFLLLRPRVAVMVAMIGGWFLLPQAPPYQFSGLPDYTRQTAIFLGILGGMALFDPRAFFRAKWSLWDLPMLVWCLSPIPSSLSNGLGLYDGLSGALDQFIMYGTPYLIGRCYFSGKQLERQLVYLIVAGGLLTLPFLVVELRLGPVFHKLIYGYEQFKWHQVWRLGWYRPPVFLRSGLAMGTWLAICGVLALWGWRAKIYKQCIGVPASVAAGLLGVFVLGMRALNGYGIYAASSGVLFSGKITRGRVVLLAFALLPVLYVGSRVTLNWDGAVLVRQARLISNDRADSLQSRLLHEVALIDHALKRPVFGWGTYNRNRPDVSDEDEPEGMMGHRSITDSLWIIAFGQKGLVGLLGIGGVLLLPAVLVWRRVPASQWATPGAGAVVALAVVACAFAYDGLVNAMYNPVVFTASGAVLGLARQRRVRRRGMPVVTQADAGAGG